MKYTQKQRIGDLGGFGEVYLCCDEKNQKYALKKLKVKNEFTFPRFEREVRLMKRLNNPNIIKLVACNLECEEPFYIMPLYQCSLVDVIPQINGDYRRQFTILNEILSGIMYLHSEGVIHRDLKPQNILYNSDTDIAITDFGLGIQLDSESATLTKFTMFMGTQKYSSPEQMKNSHKVDERTDIYAIGLIIEDIVSNYGTTEYDARIKFIIQKCTKREKEDRFISIKELSDSIRLVFNALTGMTESLGLNQNLVKLTNNKVPLEEIYSIALQVQSTKDLENVEIFFANIDSKCYEEFERNNQELVEDLVGKLCSYWKEGGWTYSYIDFIANVTKKIFNASLNPEIKAKLLYNLIELSIRFHRYYAMNVASELLTGIKNDTDVQIALSILLNAEWIPICDIGLDQNNIPPLIKEVINKYKIKHQGDDF